MVTPSRLEILTQPYGIDFQDCYSRRQKMMIDGIETPIIAYEDLLRNKRASNREKYLRDVAMLEQRRKESNH